MTFKEILDSVDIDNVLTIIENEVWKEEEPCPTAEFRSAYNILLALPTKIEHDQIFISTITAVLKDFKIKSRNILINR